MTPLPRRENAGSRRQPSNPPAPGSARPRARRRLRSEPAGQTSADNAAPDSGAAGMSDGESIPGASAPKTIDERIAERAYFIYLSRDGHGGDGDALTDWVEAERQVLAETIDRANPLDRFDQPS